MTTFKKRHPIKKKEIRKILDGLKKIFSCELFDEKERIEIARIEKFTVVLINGEADLFIIDGEPFFTIKGIMKYSPKEQFVTIDMGAVKHIANGADTMTPGIVDADINIEKGDTVWIRDEKNNRPLAVGIALMDGLKMVEKKQGKAIHSIHHIGDDLWNA
jgi:PUA domain protein